jgi:16S rRNA (guanine966-N2)-methyltransferase
MENARCLDLFAGSGALGLEAVSRGAKSVTLVDSSRTVCDHLNKNIQVLQTDRAQVVCAEASDALQSLPHTFDVIFVDPPFNENKMSAICQQLAQVLSRPAWIYTESGKHQNFHVPPDWEMIKNKSTGKVSYRLYRAF